MLHSFHEVPLRSSFNRSSVMGRGWLVGYGRVLCWTVLVGVALRMMVLVSEAYAMISSSRLSNEKLLELCNGGVAGGSPHMRTACLQARIEQASPAVVRALNSAMYAFINELYNLALQPLQALGVAGLISFCSALPWIGTLRTILPTLSSLSGLCGRTGLSTHGSFKLDAACSETLKTTPISE